MATTTMNQGVKSVPIDHAVSGNNEIVAAISGKAIRVMSLFLVTAGAVNVQFKSAGEARTGSMNFAANGGMVLPKNEDGWFQGQSGEALTIVLSAAVSVDGALNYLEIET